MILWICLGIAVYVGIGAACLVTGPAARQIRAEMWKVMCDPAPARGRVRAFGFVIRAAVLIFWPILLPAARSNQQSDEWGNFRAAAVYSARRSRHGASGCLESPEVTAAKGSPDGDCPGAATSARTAPD